MSELASKLGPFDPPKLVWVRVPAVGRQTEDLAYEGVLYQWRRTVDWGQLVWEALVECDHRGPYWTTAGNVRPR